MNDGLLIALVTIVGSSITVVANSAINMWGKWVDAHQKTNDHKFSIRSIYVTKKIDAGQAFIGKNTLRMNLLGAERLYYEVYKLEKRPNAKLAEQVEIARKNLNDIYLQRENYTSLYFDLEKTHESASSLIQKKNEHINKLNDLKHDIFSPAIENEINQILTINEQIVEIHQKMTDIVRETLSKYDIL